MSHDQGFEHGGHLELFQRMLCAELLNISVPLIMKAAVDALNTGPDGV